MSSPAPASFLTPARVSLFRTAAGPALIRLVLLALMLVAPWFAGGAFAQDRLLLTRSIGALPPEAEATARPLTDRNLAETLEFEVPLRMRDYPKLLAKIGRGEKVPREELERDHFPLAADYEAVRQWIIDQGFTITRLDPSRLAIFASGSIVQIQQSFQVEMARVTVAGVDYNAARTQPSLPAAIARPVLAINGLQPYRRPHRHLLKPAPAVGGQPPLMINDVLGGYNAVNLGVNGAGQKIAILIDAVPADSDLQSFWRANGVNQNLGNIEKVGVNGGLPLDQQEEATLDVEWSSSIAPGAKIRIYATGDLSFTAIDKGLSQIVSDAQTDPELHQLSISLGLGETYLFGSGELDTEAQYFATLAAGNVTIFVASGDAGSNPDESGHNPPGPLQVEYEASDPSVTAVGGTNLFLDASGNVTAETAWDGSGGGTSQYFARPAWQTGPGVPSGNFRCVPDVSAVASDRTYAYLYYHGHQTGVAGTSWATPTWAGFGAMINQARQNNARAPVGLLNPHLYPLIGTDNFRDITSGSNGAYSAGPGYDQVTGIGSPNVAVLLQTIAGTSSTAAIITGISPSFGPPGTVVTITGANLGGATAVAFNSKPAASFSADSTTQVTAVVPAGATSGPVSVTTPQGAAASFNPFKVLAAHPANDNISNGGIISGTSGSVAASNVGATKEPGEPNHAGNSGGHSIWYSWTAPFTGVFTFDTYGSSFDTLLAVYTGNSVASLTPVAANDDAGSGVTSAVSFTANSGTIYSIAVDGSNGASGAVNLHWTQNVVPVVDNFVPAIGSVGTVVVINGGDFTGATSVRFAGVPASFVFISPTQLSAIVPPGAVTGTVSVSTPNGTGVSNGVFTVNQPPPNDNFANATVLPGASGSVSGTNAGATKQPGEPSHAGNPGGHSIWYAWTAPAGATDVAFNTFGSTFPTLLAAYTGSAVNQLTLVAANVHTGSGLASVISFPASPNTTYYIAVDGVDGAVGSVTLNYFENVPAPVVNSFTPSVGGPGATVVITGSSFSYATAVAFGGVPAVYTINSDGQITATVPQGSVTGPVAVVNIGGTGLSAVDFTVSAAPGNDDFASAFSITGLGGVTGSNFGATKETGEPNHAGNAGGASAWWNWTAPATADYTVSTLGSDFHTLLAVYTGSTVSALNLVASNDQDPGGGNSSLLVLHAVAGTLYHLAVDGFDGATGHITLSIISAQVGVLYSTGFESAEGYVTTSPLAGQNGWVGQGAPVTGLLSGFFSGLGQQAFIGGAKSVGASSVAHPVNYTRKSGDALVFQAIMQVQPSTNGFSDDFGWSLVNGSGAVLFTLHFDNSTGKIGFELDDKNGVRDTGFTFDHQTVYNLSVQLDFSNNLWNASVSGKTVVSHQPISTSGAALTLGSVAADCFVKGAQAGDNALVFDNVSLSNTGNIAPTFFLQPQPQTAPAGSTVVFSAVAGGTAPVTYQWFKNSLAIPGATKPLLTLNDVQGADAASYYVVATNPVGARASNEVRLVVTPTDAANLAPYRPQGWSDRVVVTNSTLPPFSTTDDTQIRSNDSLYVDFAVINGGVEAASACQDSLYLDGVLLSTFNQGALAPNVYFAIPPFAIGQLTAGTHTLQLVVDSANQVVESDKSDNTYTKTIFVSNVVGSETIAASVSPPGSGTVAGAGTYAYGGRVTLVASASPGYKFVGWTNVNGFVSTAATLPLLARSGVDLIANFASTGANQGPAVAISVPVPAPAYSTLFSVVNLGGTASSSAGLKQINWSSDKGPSGKAVGTTAWTVRAVPLSPGINTITVTAVDKAGASSSSSIRVSSVSSASFAGSYYGLVATEDAVPSYIGLGQLSVNAAGGFSASIYYKGLRHPLLGTVLPDGSFHTVLGSLVGSYLAVDLTVTPGNEPTVSGTISDGATTASISAARLNFSARSHPFGHPGQYNVALLAPPSNGVNTGPSGTGYGIVRITSSGLATFSGRLADGSAFAGGAGLSDAGLLPFHSVIVSGRGWLAGPLSFANPLDVAGVTDWHKSFGAPGSAYPAAIISRLTALGSAFVAPKPPATVLAPGNREVTLSAGGLPQTVTEPVSLIVPANPRLSATAFAVNDANTSRLKMAVSPASGAVSGTFLDLETGRLVGFSGILLQAQDVAYGYFLGYGEGGAFQLGAAAP